MLIITKNPVVYRGYDPCDMILVSELRVYNVESYVRGLIL